MGSEVIGSIVLWLIVVAIVIVIAVYLLRWLYRRSTKETAFVRTGFGGEKVVINGGAFVIPVLHEMTPVNMNVMRIEVRRGETTALDHPRPDARRPDRRVLPARPAEPRGGVRSPRKPSAAGPCSRNGIRDLFEGKFASSLRAVAAELTLAGDSRAAPTSSWRGCASRPRRRSPSTASTSRTSRSSTSTRPASNSSIRPTPSTPRASPR